MKRLRSSGGFTIIEVLIVLAIFGLIMIIVFLAVPALKRNQRNVTSKNYADEAAAQMDTYRANNTTYPDTPTKQCDFIKNYLAPQSFAPSSCVSDAAKSCEFASLPLVDVCFRPYVSPHDYLGPYSELVIQFGHFCNTPNHTDGTSNPIISSGNDTDVNKYVIYVQLESAPLYCIDNSPN